VRYNSSVARPIAQIPLQSYKAALPVTLSLEPQGVQPVSFTYEDALTGRPHPEESWVLKGKMGTELKDISRLRPTIHGEFANWGNSPQQVERFTKRFGVLRECTSDDLYHEFDFSFEVSEWLEDQKKFRAWWRCQLGPKPPLKLSSESALKKMEREARQIQRSTMGLPPIEDTDEPGSYLDDLKDVLEYREPGPSEYRWPIAGNPTPSLVLIGKNKGISVEIVAPNLWTYMILLLLREKPAMLRVCQNKTCPNPYFVATRKDQKFCCSVCSQLVASRRWWASHGSARRRKRSVGKGKKGLEGS
jgi:hypothetical protein